MHIKKEDTYSGNLKGTVLTYTADKASVEMVIREDKTASILNAVGTQKGIARIIKELEGDHQITVLANQVHRKHEAKAMLRAGLYPCLSDGEFAKKTNVKGVLAMMASAPSNSILMKKYYNY